MDDSRQGLPDSPAMLITVASTDCSRQIGKLLHEVEHGNVVRILDLQNREVRAYLTREPPESVREVIEEEGPLPARLFPSRRVSRRPDPAELAPMRAADIADTYGVTFRTAQQWHQDACRAVNGHAHA